MSIMNQSILITGGNFKERDQRARRLAAENLELKDTKELDSHPDFMQISPDETASISISQIRELNKNLLFKPLRAPLRVAFIEEAQLLTLEAQNAFLKTLEEPPEKVVIILCTRDPQQILVTLVSRCRLIMLAQKPEIELLEKEEKEFTEILLNLFTSDLGQKFSWAEKLGPNKEEALLQLDKMAVVGRTLMLKLLQQEKNVYPKAKKYHNFLKQTEKIKNFVRANVNPRFALENLFNSC